MDRTSLIYKVLEGAASQAQRKALDDWIALSKANKNEFDDIKLFWEHAGHAQQVEHDEHFYDGFHRIKARVKQKRKRARQVKTTIALIALLASAIISLSVILFMYRGNDKEFRGNLSFENANLSHVIATLEKTYGIHIEAERKEIMDCRFTGTFYRTDAVNKVLQSLAEALNLNYELLDSGKHRLTGSGCLTMQ